MRGRSTELVMLLLVAAVVIAEGVRIATEPRNQKVYGAADSGLYLVVLGSILACLAAFHTLGKWRDGEASPRWGERVDRALLTFALLGGFVFLMGYLGYTISLALFFVVFFRLFSRYRWGPILIGSLLMAAGSAYGWASLGMMLPQGILSWP